MLLRERKLAVLLLLGCVIAAQVHVWADLDTCVLKGGTSHNGPGHNHRCTGCENGNVVVAGMLLNVAPLLTAAQIDLQTGVLFISEHRAEGRAPRAPPQ